MDETEVENGEEAIDESGRNPTQQEIDEEGTTGEPVDADWEKSPVERDDTAIGRDADE
jgi:hypothetical protein